MIKHFQGDCLDNLILKFKIAINGTSMTKFTADATRDWNQIVFTDPNGQKYSFQLSEKEGHLNRDGSEELDLLF